MSINVKTHLSCGGWLGQLGAIFWRSVRKSSFFKGGIFILYGRIIEESSYSIEVSSFSFSLSFCYVYIKFVSKRTGEDGRRARLEEAGKNVIFSIKSSCFSKAQHESVMFSTQIHHAFITLSECSPGGSEKAAAEARSLRV